jgi:hypothetical protein
MCSSPGSIPLGQPSPTDWFPVFPRKQSAVPVERFEVVVRGRLSPELVATMEGFDVTRCAHALTHLVGSVADQAELHKLFQVLRDLNIALVSVTALDQGSFDSL